MKTRLLSALIAGVVGTLIGFGLAFLLQKEGEPFPLMIPVALITLFALCGAFAKRKWIDAIYDFIVHVWP